MPKLVPSFQAFDWNELSTLRLRAQAIADGLYVGNHRSARRGVGVEFGGRRNYVPGDDLRWLDRHALMRHGKLLVREFETETDRLLYLVIDATASMTYRSDAATVSKWTYTATIASALSRIALASGDPVALDWIGGEKTRWLPAMSGREAFDRVLAAIDTTRPSGRVPLGEAAFERCLLPVGRYARRGTIVVVLSDLLDLPEGAINRLSELGSGQRSLVVVRILDPAEERFPFEGATRFAALEGEQVVETDATLVKDSYLEHLATYTAHAEELLKSRGGRLFCTNTADNPVSVVRQIVQLIGSVGA
jgi:uncharacterized protein (DUF58 family)